MGFEETREDFWGGRGDSSHSRENFLKTAVKCGAVQTGYWNGHESPYYGAHSHAESLAADGLLKRWEGPYRVRQILEEESIWIPTEAGKKMAEGS
jgi:hypothetical protein